MVYFRKLLLSSHMHNNPFCLIFIFFFVLRPLFIRNKTFAIITNYTCKLIPWVITRINMAPFPFQRKANPEHIIEPRAHCFCAFPLRTALSSFGEIPRRQIPECNRSVPQANMNYQYSFRAYSLIWQFDNYSNCARGIINDCSFLPLGVARQNIVTSHSWTERDFRRHFDDARICNKLHLRS
jgi:hypothetical protein